MLKSRVLLSSLSLVLKKSNKKIPSLSLLSFQRCSSSSSNVIAINNTNGYDNIDNNNKNDVPLYIDTFKCNTNDIHDAQEGGYININDSDVSKYFPEGTTIIIITLFSSHILISLL